MKTLENLSIKKGWIYETIFVSGSLGAPHAAPIGVWTDNSITLNAEIYKGSKTLANILQRQNFSVNLPADVGAIFSALYARDRLAYEDAQMIEAPILKGASASIEVTVKSMVDKEKTFLIEGEIVFIGCSGNIHLINRAEGLVVENLVLATKRPCFPGTGIEAAILENHRVVRKVAPGSEHEAVSASLIKILNL